MTVGKSKGYALFNIAHLEILDCCTCEQSARVHRATVGLTPPKLNRGEPVLTILLIVVLILMLGGGGYYGYSSYGGRGLGGVLGLVLVIVLVVWLVGGLPIHS